MTMDEKIKRINELYHKSKNEGLTEDEKAEQASLRQAYIQSIKMNLRSQLDNIVVEKPDGTIIDIGEEHAKKSAAKKKYS